MLQLSQAFCEIPSDVGVRKEGACDKCPVWKLWLLGGRPGLVLWVWEGTNMGSISSTDYNLSTVSVFRGQSRHSW